MKRSTKLATGILLTACVFAFNANAAEVKENSPLHKLVTSIVKSSLNAVSQEIDVQLEKNVLTANHNFSIDTEESPQGKVKIIDLVAKASVEDAKKTKAE